MLGDPPCRYDSEPLSRGAAGLSAPQLLGIGHLETHEILFLLDEAEQWVELNRQPKKHTDRLAGLTIINAFFENSTRTLLSFEIAGKRLGADVVNMHAAQSSVKKGETLIDTAMTLNAMRVDAIVIRHGSSGAVQLIADKVVAGDQRRDGSTSTRQGAARRARACAQLGARRAKRIHGGGAIAATSHRRVARSNVCAEAIGASEGSERRRADAGTRIERSAWSRTMSRRRARRREW